MQSPAHVNNCAIGVLGSISAQQTVAGLMFWKPNMGSNKQENGAYQNKQSGDAEGYAP
jgi:hypothetical protein